MSSKKYGSFFGTLEMCGCEYQVEGDTHAHSVFLSIDDCSEVYGGLKKALVVLTLFQ